MLKKGDVVRLRFHEGRQFEILRVFDGFAEIQEKIIYDGNVTWGVGYVVGFRTIEKVTDVEIYS